jgi:3-oxoacyl-(acyl-carrier-protein) synthase
MPPTSSILAHTGESAASAMLRLAAAVRACEHGWCPPTLGLTDPEPRHGDFLLRRPLQATVNAVLVPSFGQGGSNGAVVVEQA